MDEIPRPANFTFGGAWFRQGPSEVHLIAGRDTTAPAGQPDSGPARSSGLASHVAFEVDDLVAFQRQFAAHDVDIAAGPMPRGDGVEQVFVHDPDGYFVEVFQRTDAKAAPQRGPVSR